MSLRIVPRWLPALFVMSLIFWFSAQPSNELPNFGWFDYAVKKISHIIEYAVLALCLWYAFESRADARWRVWLIALLYALSDEFHQSFVPGRFPSLVDALVFDHLGILLAIYFGGTRESS